MLGVFGVVAFLLPWQLGAVDEARLREAATASSSLLARECEAVGDRAALVASRLLVRVSVADGEQEPPTVVAENAAEVLRLSQQAPWTLLVLSPDGEVVAATPITVGVDHDAVHVVVPRGGTAARLDRPLRHRLP